MADVFCSSLAVVRKAGGNVNTTAANSGALISQYINSAEAQICLAAKFNFLDTYNSLDVSMAFILNDIASSLAAIPLINYNMSGYTSREEAQTMLDVNRDIAERGLKKLEDKDYVNFLNAT